MAGSGPVLAAPSRAASPRAAQPGEGGAETPARSPPVPSLSLPGSPAVCEPWPPLAVPHVSAWPSLLAWSHLRPRRPPTPGTARSASSGLGQWPNYARTGRGRDSHTGHPAPGLRALSIHVTVSASPDPVASKDGPPRFSPFPWNRGWIRAGAGTCAGLRSGPPRRPTCARGAVALTPPGGPGRLQVPVSCRGAASTCSRGGQELRNAESRWPSHSG